MLCGTKVGMLYNIIHNYTNTRTALHELFVQHYGQSELWN